jgi:hypothetical protein
MDTPGQKGRGPGSTPQAPGPAKDPSRPSKIQHPAPGISSQSRPSEPGPVPVADPTGPLTAARKITAFGREQKHEEEWSRTPNTTGTGAIHVKTFHSKLTDDALVYMDQCINEWLDAHPEYEVKFVTTSVGIVTGKLKEPHLVCQVWV